MRSSWPVGFEVAVSHAWFDSRDEGGCDGSGGLGGYFGALLARGGADVSFIARGAQLQAIRRDGLRIEGGPDPFLLEDVRVTDDPDELGAVELVLLR